jgi:hypothetical protein
MAANARPWLIGCAIGCGLLVVLMGVIAVGSAFFVRDMVQRVEETRSASEDLDDRFGKVTDFRPAADGSINPLRIEAFLEARSSGEDDAWQARLTAEVEAMENSRHRLPWQDGLPDFMAESLEPFREQLAASYSELCNPLETGTGP